MFEGVYENGNRLHGVLRLANGAVFEGSFENDKKNGLGKMSWPNGDVYTGVFRENMRSGKGTLVNLRRSSLFIGEYRNNRKSGVAHAIELGVAERLVWNNDVLVSSMPVQLKDFPPRDEDEEDTLVSTHPCAPEAQCLARESLGATIALGAELVVPTWVVVRVFAFFSASTLGTLCRVSREWKRVAENNVFWRRLCFDWISWENLVEIPVNFKLMRHCQLRVFAEEEVRDGCGTFDWKNGNLYCGEWKQGHRHGWGYMVYNNKDTYTGGWDHDKKHGQGFVKYANGATYLGQFVQGRKEGKGRLRFANNDVYSGDWEDGKKHGHGSYWWSDGALFDGSYVYGKKEGPGKIVYNNGDVYVGTLVDGKREGFGEETWLNGERYVGEYKGGKRQGKGKCTHADGSTYEGSFFADEKSGFGIFTSRDGKTRYEGEHFNGRWHGEGVLTERGKPPVRARWNKGKLEKLLE